MGVLGGHFDGPLARRILLSRINATERTKADKLYYDSCLGVQKANRLPDGCPSDAFSRRAVASVLHLMPNLAQKCTQEDAADYIVDMMPPSLREAGKRVTYRSRPRSYTTCTCFARSSTWPTLGPSASRTPNTPKTRQSCEPSPTATGPSPARPPATPSCWPAPASGRSPDGSTASRCHPARPSSTPWPSAPSSSCTSPPPWRSLGTSRTPPSRYSHRQQGRVRPLPSLHFRPELPPH